MFFSEGARGEFTALPSSINSGKNQIIVRHKTPKYCIIKVHFETRHHRGL